MADVKREGRLDQAKGRIRSAWAGITDDDFEHARGDMERLIGRIKEKTGESAEDIRARLDDVLQEED
jgi:uncharacterized protein YjbJ (UPF0337 family)